MSKRALWLAVGALSLGFVVVSCTGSDGSTNFDATGGDGAGGDDASVAGTSSKAGTQSTGGSNTQAGAGQGEDGGNSTSSGGQGSGDAGSSSSNAGAPGGGTDPNGGQPGAGGDATSGGAPTGNAGAPSGDAGAGGAGSDRMPCESAKQCDPGQVCVKASCDGQKAGVCSDAPATPVCGCDGVTYFDGTLALAAEQDVRAKGACQGDTAMACDTDCKEGLTCGIVELRNGDCQTKVGGVCWQLPKECPALPLSFYNVCGTDTCLGLCDAVKNGAHAVPGGLVCAIIN